MIEHPSPFDRRTFLGQSATVLAAGALASSGLPRLLAGSAPTRPLRVGLVSAASYGRLGVTRTQGSNHGTAFASACNGFDAEKRRTFTGTFVAAKKRLEGVQVTRVWDPIRSAAENLAAVCNIPVVCDSAEECAQEVDAVLIIDDGSGEHWKFAVTSLQRGVPTFCDKPLAMTAKEAQGIAAIARRSGTAFMSASSLRFVPDIVALTREAPALGEIHLATTACGNELVYYGIHALSMAYAVLGRGAVSCLNVGQPGRNLVRVRFQNGCDLMVIVGEREWMRAGYQINLYGSKGWRSVTPVLDDLYWYLLDRFFDLVRTGRESVAIEEEVEVIAVLEAGKRSLEEKREVTIAEMLA